MFDSIWNDLKWRFQQGSTLTRIIIINCAVFILVNLVRIILVFVDGAAPPPSYQPFIEFFCMPSDWKTLLTHPWVLITSMFLHESFWHLFWNMVLLYWFGIIVSDLVGAKRILPIYIIGGLSCLALYFIMANIPSFWQIGNYAMGASGAVMAMLLVAGTTAPNWQVSLLLIGAVRLKYLVLALVFLDIIALSWNSSSGGSFGHLGGAIMGYIIAWQLKNGRDLTLPVSKVIDWIAGLFIGVKFRKSPVKVAYKSQNKGGTPQNKPPKYQDADRQNKLDTILDKIKKSGYDSLTDDEKQFLFTESKR
jgi:membrane associated rhomboid family serine protease